MAKKITISFKDHEEDLYEYIKNKLSPSIYMKELIKKDISKPKEEYHKSTKRNMLDDI